MVFLDDAAGSAFASQALPAGLPLSGLANRYGLIYLTDDNGDETGRLTFAISSIQPVPEPSAVALLAAAGLALAAARPSRRAVR
jgi:hypothetical protein